MSFSKAPLKRFNENGTIHSLGPGAYDPQFATDVAISATSKASRSRMIRSNSRPVLKRLSSVERCRTPLTPLPAVHIVIPKESSVQEKLSNSEKMHEEALGMLNAGTHKNAELEEQVTKLKEDIANWIATSETCQVSIAELTASLEDLQERLGKSELEADTLKKALEKAEEEKQVNTVMLQSSLRDSQKIVDEYQTKNAELDKRIASVEMANHALETDKIKMDAAFSEERSAHKEAEEKYSHLQQNLDECYSVYEDELNSLRMKNRTFQDTETKLINSLELSKSQIEELQKTVLAEKKARVHSEEELGKTLNMLSTLTKGWELKEADYIQDITRLEKILKSYLENPKKLLNEHNNEMVREYLETRKKNSELKIDIAHLEKPESIRKQGLEIDLSEQLTSLSFHEGLDGITLPKMHSFSDDEACSLKLDNITSPISNACYDIYDMMSTSEFKRKVQALKHSHTEVSLKSAMQKELAEEQKELAASLIAKVEQDSQLKRECISRLQSQLIEADKLSTDTKELKCPSSGINTTPDTTLQIPMKFTTAGSEKGTEGASALSFPRTSSGRSAISLMKLDSIAEEEKED